MTLVLICPLGIGEDEAGKGMSAGAVTATVLSVVFAVIVLVALVTFCFLKKKKRDHRGGKKIFTYLCN